jgi:hypothetical protein
MAKKISCQYNRTSGFTKQSGNVFINHNINYLSSVDIRLHDTRSGKIAEIVSDNIVLKDTDDTLNLIAEAGAMDSGKIILYESQINPDFFDLKTKLAGEILQKFSNYRVQLAIIGDFSKFKSKSLQAFIYECNKGRSLFFQETLDDAIIRLSGDNLFD